VTPALQPYPAYKDSGVPWLGQVPEGWEVRKLRNVLASTTERNRPDLPLLSIVREKGVILRDTSSKDENHNYIPDDLTNYKVVRAGQFAMNKMKAWQGSYGVSKYEGIVSPAYFIFNLSGVEGEYFHAAIRSRAYVPCFAQASDGVRIGQWDLSQARMKEMSFCLPPLPEQASIVRYLGYMDRRIRKYILAKQKLIKLLEEQKQAIIHEAVTGRIDVRTGNPYPKYKDSGVEWLGQVPEGWEVRTLGQIATSFRTGPFGSILHQSDYVEGGTPLVNPTHMNGGMIVEDTRCSVPPSVADRLSTYLLAKHDLIFSRRGELGRCALVRDREAGWLCGTGSIRVRVAYIGIEPEYLIKALQVRWVGEYLSLFSIGATMDSLNTGILKGVPVLLPPVIEQRQLLDRIEQDARIIQRAAADAEREIFLLREYRTRLIADVVTGKVDVRGVAAGLPEEGAGEEGAGSDGLDESDGSAMGEEAEGDEPVAEEGEAEE
jgi:type I restriction enzyme S subunit